MRKLIAGLNWKTFCADKSMTAAAKDSRERILLITAAVAAVAAALVWKTSGPAVLSFGLRWIGLLALIAYGCLRRTLSAWIFVAMFLGAEIGHDFPILATHLRVLALIFLRLIKAIIAPLLFATLVVGIAGHSNLKQVGRMGVKALIYFEVVTTLALLIGWAAI